MTSSTKRGEVQPQHSRRGRTRPPVAFVVLAAIGAALFVLPLLAMIFRAPWRNAWSIITEPQIREALRLSLICSLSATALSFVFGVPLAWVQARMTFRGRSVLRAVTTLPVVLPPVVGGLALLLAVGRNGIVGRFLFDWFSIRLPFTTAGAIVAETFVSMPFLVLSMEGAFANSDTRLEEAASTLGASRWTVFTKITLPGLRPASDCGRCVVLGPGAWGVRSHHHLRRQLPWDHADRAVVGVSSIRDQPSGGHHVEPAAGVYLAGDSHHASPSIVRAHVTNFLDARIVVRYPQLTVDVEIGAARGEIIGLVGPNGAGKSTVLRAIAGLQVLDDGHITIANSVVDDPADEVLVPPPQRRVGVVFQDYRLFPHLNALDNVAFGLRCRGMKRDTARAAAADWLKRLDVIDHAGHKPSTLSGGQAQRVALARALATVPDVLLLDEPFAAIDTDARGRIRDDLARYLSGFTGTTILVSHQPEEIRALTSKALVLERGGVVWEGPSQALEFGPTKRAT